MSGCHGEIAISQRRVAPRSAKSAAMTVARRSCSPRGVCGELLILGKSVIRHTQAYCNCSLHQLISDCPPI
jgi:hypothetical protein